MFHGSSYGSAYAALMSPSILKENNTCFLVFYFKLQRTGKASLSVLFEEFHGNVTGNESKTTLLWTTNSTVNNWRKKTLTLPQAYNNYSVIFLGYFKSTSYYDTNYVAIDDVQFLGCDTSE